MQTQTERERDHATINLLCVFSCAFTNFQLWMKKMRARLAWSCLLRGDISFMHSERMSPPPPSLPYHSCIAIDDSRTHPRANNRKKERWYLFFLCFTERSSVSNDIVFSFYSLFSVHMRRCLFWLYYMRFVRAVIVSYKLLWHKICASLRDQTHRRCYSQFTDRNKYYTFASNRNKI